MKARIECKNGGTVWFITLSEQFDGHAEDKAAFDKFFRDKFGEKYPRAKGFVQQITLVKE
jgi:hypothetical protein